MVAYAQNIPCTAPLKTATEPLIYSYFLQQYNGGLQYVGSLVCSVTSMGAIDHISVLIRTAINDVFRFFSELSPSAIQNQTELIIILDDLRPFHCIPYVDILYDLKSLPFWCVDCFIRFRREQLTVRMNTCSNPGRTYLLLCVSV